MSADPNREPVAVTRPSLRWRLGLPLLAAGLGLVALLTTADAARGVGVGLLIGAATAWNRLLAPRRLGQALVLHLVAMLVRLLAAVAVLVWAGDLGLFAAGEQAGIVGLAGALAAVVLLDALTLARHGRASVPTLQESLRA